MNKSTPSEIWSVCVSAPAVDGKTFQSVFRSESGSECSDLKIALKGDAEWSDARKEAVGLLGDRGELRCVR